MNEQEPRQVPQQDSIQQLAKLQAEHPHLRFVAGQVPSTYPKITEADISNFEMLVQKHRSWRVSKGLPI